MDVNGRIFNPPETSRGDDKTITKRFRAFKVGWNIGEEADRNIFKDVPNLDAAHDRLGLDGFSVSNQNDVVTSHIRRIHQSVKAVHDEHYNKKVYPVHPMSTEDTYFKETITIYSRKREDRYWDYGPGRSTLSKFGSRISRRSTVRSAKPCQCWILTTRRLLAAMRSASDGF